MLVANSQIQSFKPAAFKSTGLLAVKKDLNNIHKPINMGIKTKVSNGNDIRYTPSTRSISPPTKIHPQSLMALRLNNENRVSNKPVINSPEASNKLKNKYDFSFDKLIHKPNPINSTPDKKVFHQYLLS